VPLISSQKTYTQRSLVRKIDSEKTDQYRHRDIFDTQTCLNVETHRLEVVATVFVQAEIVSVGIVTREPCLCTVVGARARPFVGASLAGASVKEIINPPKVGDNVELSVGIAEGNGSSIAGPLVVGVSDRSLAGLLVGGTNSVDGERVRRLGRAFSCPGASLSVFLNNFVACGEDAVATRVWLFATLDMVGIVVLVELNAVSALDVATRVTCCAAAVASSIQLQLNGTL
jgi:hypothetical protein